MTETVEAKVTEALYEASHLLMGQTYTRDHLYHTASRLCDIPYFMVAWVGSRRPEDHYKPPNQTYEKK